MAVVAAAMAVKDAGMEEGSFAGDEAAVALGTAFGSTSFTYKLLKQIRDEGALAVSPFLFMETVANAHAGQVALAHSATGANFTISQREASGLLALCRGADLVRHGRFSRVLAGAVDEVSPIQHAALAAYRALARDAMGVERAQVFGANRSGFLVAEGATIWVLEDEQRARGRGAPLRARIVATVRANDCTAEATDWGVGHQHLGSQLRRGLGRQGIELDSIDRVVSGASGALRGDHLEGLTLISAFGGKALPPILCPKAVTGEYGGGFLAAALMALDGVDWRLARTLGEVDPNIDLRPHGGESMGPAQRVLVTSLATGGAGCWLVLERSD
jgi:3-oxoacyl-[acyl-carrier-protein] synthase II